MTTKRLIGFAMTLVVFAGCAVNPERRIERLFTDYTGEVPGVAVGVIQDGRFAFTGTYGLANLETGEPVTTATNFRLASITKQFTAMAILMLVEQQRLSLDSVLLQVFQDFPAYGDDISIEHLLQHRSGLKDYEPIVPADAEEQVHDADVLAMMVAAEEAYFPAGSAYRYSNSGYAVLAMIVEEMGNASFAEFLERRIFAPLGMDGTVAFEDRVSDVRNRAIGYTVDDDGVQWSDQSVFSAVLGDGGIYSSLDDLYLWDQALYRDELIGAEMKAKMFTPALENYGYGWRIDEYRGHYRQHHSGSTSGFRNYLQRFPEEKLTVIVLTNRAGPDVQPLAEAISDLYLGGSAE